MGQHSTSAQSWDEEPVYLWIQHRRRALGIIIHVCGQSPLRCCCSQVCSREQEQDRRRFPLHEVLRPVYSVFYSKSLTWSTCSGHFRKPLYGCRGCPTGGFILYSFPLNRYLIDKLIYGQETLYSRCRTTRRSAMCHFSSSLFGRLGFGCGCFREKAVRVLLPSLSPIQIQARAILRASIARKRTGSMILFVVPDALLDPVLLNVVSIGPNRYTACLIQCSIQICL
jgi:hypothetical protein